MAPTTLIPMTVTSALDTASDPDRHTRHGAPSLDLSTVVETDKAGTHTLQLLASTVHCGGCVRKIEDRLAQEPDIETARVNLSTRRLTIRWKGSSARANAFAQQVEELGFPVSPYRSEALLDRDKKTERELIMALAVSFFGAANLMMLAWAVWAGHFATMGQGTRDFFHWVAALIAVPCVYYAGLPFFRSAIAALKKRRTNMDVPISVGVTLTTLMSVYETMTGGPHVYFDGALTLLFILLVGRFLDHKVRGAAHSAVHDLALLAGQPVQKILPDGTLRAVAPDSLERGDCIHVALGERIGADGVVQEGMSSIDTALIDGETTPKDVAPGMSVLAGTMNLSGPLVVEAKNVGEATVLAEIVRLLEAAEQKKGRYMAFADQVVRWYSPTVHTLAASAFFGWWLLGGMAMPEAMMIAVCVLIITCPCALGIAVPITQVVAAGKLSRLGVLLKSDTALERFAAIDTIVFDKTGTLTTLEPRLIGTPDDKDALLVASSMAATSKHPLAQGIRAALPNAPRAKDVEDMPGKGLRWMSEQGEVRLGSAAWCNVKDVTEQKSRDGGLETEVWLTRPGHAPARFSFAPLLRPRTGEAIDALRDQGMAISIMSGDRSKFVAPVAEQLGIKSWQGEMTPADKIAAIEAMKAEGKHILMVGDGLNDTPALAAAHASLAPTTAADISRNAADAVFQGETLLALPELLTIAKRTKSIVIQNITFSVAYNLLLIPIAVMGLVTPWIAAFAMAASSLVVTVNALRLDGLKALQRIATRQSRAGDPIATSSAPVAAPTSAPTQALKAETA
ncbi:MAG: heavy metal translocating P-type ATPase [Pseudomonadota bacterium]